MKTGHGGKREGAGKPAQFEKPMKRKEIMLPDEAIEFFLALGKGNLSAGVRQAWRSLTKRAADGWVGFRQNDLFNSSELSVIGSGTNPATRR